MPYLFKFGDASNGFSSIGKENDNTPLYYLKNEIVVRKNYN